MFPWFGVFIVSLGERGCRNLKAAKLLDYDEYQSTTSVYKWL